MASFGELLRDLRVGAGLTQEGLAETAGVSARAVSDLERGVYQTARKDTARLLADALHLTGPGRAAFEAAASGRVYVGVAVAASRTLPRDVASFTGREEELARVRAVAGSPAGLCVIGGMAGAGKTAFAVHAAHLLAPGFPDGQVFLPLHAHTPGQAPVDPADAVVSLLRVTGFAADQVPPGLEARVWLWRDHVAGKRLLLVLDDAADSEQVRPLLPGAADSLVLVTSRRHLTGLDDATALTIEALPPDQAGSLVVRLAGRTGLERVDPAVAEICGLCANLPLALGMMARRLHHHPAWRPEDLAAELAAARDRLALMHTEDLSVIAAFNLSYQDLDPDQQQFFRRLGLHPGTDIDAYATAALVGISLDAARHGLEDLYDHYLLAEPGPGRYRFHDLIKDYAHDLAADDHLADRVAATDRVLDYYLHTARVADHHIGRRMPAVHLAPPAHAPELATRSEAISWMEAERGNLHAAAQYAAACARPGHAAAIPAAMHEFLRGQGHWHQALTLDHLALDAARRAEGPLTEALALTHLAEIQYLTDDYQAAAASLGQALDLYRSLGHRTGEANALTLQGTVQHAAGAPDAACASLSQALSLYRELGDQLGEANALTQLGSARQAAGNPAEAAGSLSAALGIYRHLGDQLGQANVLTDTATVQRRGGDDPGAAASLAEALELYRALGDRPGQARALNGLGELELASADATLARSRHEQALAIATDIASLSQQARALEGLGCCDLHDHQYARSSTALSKALAIYRQIRAPDAQRLEAKLRDHELGSATQPPQAG